MGKSDPRDPLVRSLASVTENMVGDFDHSAARGIQGEVARIYRGAEALDRVRTSRSPLDTPAAHALKVAKLARKLESEIAASRQRVGHTMKEALKDVERRIGEKVNLTPDNYAPEIRATYRLLPPKAQAELVMKLINENRGPELAALVNAPTILTGMVKGEADAYAKGIVREHAAAELAEEERLTAIFDHALNASNIAEGFVKGLSDPAELARIEQGEAEANAAGAAFDQSLAQ